MDKDTIITAPNQAIYDAPLYIFAILSSRMHCLWLEVVGGKLRTDYRYSSEIIYNTFPIRNLNNIEIGELNKLSLQILDIREKFSQKTISEIYDPKHMPHNLLETHKRIDKIIEGCYSKNSPKNDDERINLLFKEYEMKLNQDKLI